MKIKILKHLKVNLNFFGDKHGKNNRDAHFSNLSRFVHAESLVKRLVSSQDIVDAIQKRQLIANQNKTGFCYLFGFLKLRIKDF